MSENLKPPPCLLCRADLRAIWPSHVSAQADGAVVFYAAGNYGSTVYDPAGVVTRADRLLVVNVCDACLVSAAEAGLIHAESRRDPQPIITREPWAPPPVESDDDETG